MVLSAALLASVALAKAAPTCTLTFDNTPTHPDVLSVLSFQNIDLYKVKIQGEDLNGRTYELRVKRFDKGKKTLDYVQFDSAELVGMGLGKVTGGELGFRLVSQVKDAKAKIEYQFNRVNTTKAFDASKSKYDYVMKTFLGAKNSMTFDPTKETYFLALLLPYEKADGSSSYCEVAQSGFDPETMGTKFKVPTYFLLSIRFK
jgi:hypothetical protein